MPITMAGADGESSKRRSSRTRLDDNRASYRRYWWQFAEKRPELQVAIADLDACCIASLSATHMGFRLPTGHDLYSPSPLIVFPLDTYAAFCVASVPPARSLDTILRIVDLKDDLRYTPSDCFETFPFPEGWASDPALEAAGRAYYEHRAALMVRNNEGLTKTYNRFHDPYERDPGIERLRELHAEMDRAVLRAYGWDDIPTECEFLLDYEIDEEEWGNKRKPYRYRWPDDVRDEVLARLLALNGERAAAEQRSGAAAAKRGRRARRKVAVPAQMEVLL